MTVQEQEQNAEYYGVLGSPESKADLPFRVHHLYLYCHLLYKPPSHQISNVLATMVKRLRNMTEVLQRLSTLPFAQNWQHVQ